MAAKPRPRQIKADFQGLDNGSAGILPAPFGILPNGLHLFRFSPARMPESAGWKPALPETRLPSRHFSRGVSALAASGGTTEKSIIFVSMSIDHRGRAGHGSAMKYLIPAFAFLFLVSLSSHGQEVIIDTTFAKDKPGAAPAVDPGAPDPLEHPSSISLPEGSSISVLAQPEGNIKPPALLLTSPEGSNESYTHIISWGGFQTALDSGKYELTFTAEGLDSPLSTAWMRVDFIIDGNVAQGPRAGVGAGLSEVKIAIDLDKGLWSINGGEEQPMRASDSASPVAISHVMFGIAGSRKGGDEPPVHASGGRYVLGPVKLVKVSK
jgi:hypothetical protein